MAVYDDVERRLCEKCGQTRDVRTMSMIGGTGRWICKPCSDLIAEAVTSNRTEVTYQAPSAIGKTGDPNRLVRLLTVGADVSEPMVALPVDDWPSEIAPFGTNRKARRARKAMARRRG